MRELEADAERRLTRALSRLRRDVLGDLSESDVPYLTARLGSQSVLQPFTDAVVAVLRDIALEGAAFGRTQIERAVFGVDDA